MGLNRYKKFVEGTLGRSADANMEFDSFLTYINKLLHQDGSVAMNTNLFFSGYDYPTIVLAGNEVDAEMWFVAEGGGDLHIMKMDPTPIAMVLLTSTSNTEITDGTDNLNLLLDNHMVLTEDDSDGPRATLSGTEGSGEAWRLVSEPTNDRFSFRLWNDPTWDGILKLETQDMIWHQGNTYFLTEEHYDWTEIVSLDAVSGTGITTIEYVATKSLAHSGLLFAKIYNVKEYSSERTAVHVAAYGERKTDSVLQHFMEIYVEPTHGNTWEFDIDIYALTEDSTV